MQPLPASAANRTPWIIAGVLVLVTVVAVLYAAVHRIGPSAPAMANAGNAGSGQAASGAPAGFPSGPAPDISNMTPREQFDRLDARIMQAADKGDTATVVTFTPMALGAYANLPAADRDIDARYDAAMLEAQVGMLPEAKALADTILQLAPDNLLGVLRARRRGRLPGRLRRGQGRARGVPHPFQRRNEEEPPRVHQAPRLPQQLPQGRRSALMATTIRVAHSPDSDDAFMFYALASGKIDTGSLRYVHELSDIESLNQRARRKELDVSAVSIHAYAYLADDYALLGSGSSMGDGYGPRLVGRDAASDA